MERFQVASTPSGGVRSVRVELPAGWEEKMPVAGLLSRIRAA